MFVIVHSLALPRRDLRGSRRRLRCDANFVLDHSIGLRLELVRALEAMIHGLTLDEVFVERAVSGSRPIGERPEGARLLTAVRLGDVIITPKLDQMFRSALDALEVLAKLEDRGVGLHMIDLGGDVTGNGISKLVFTILSAVAETERDRTSERITEVKRDQRARGRFLGGSVPFGYRLDSEGNLIPHEAEQQALLEALAMRFNGSSLRAIAAELKAKGHSVSHVAVARALKDCPSHV